MNRPDNSDYIILSSTLSSSAPSGTEWKKDILPQDVCLSSPVTEDKPETDRFLYMDPIPQDIVGSRGMDTSVCNAHSSIHEKSKQLDRGMHGKTSSKTGHLMMHSPSRELSVRRGKSTFKHQCPTCLKPFCTPYKLKRHILIHTGQKPFSCVKCGKAFRQAEHLKSHLNAANNCSRSQSIKRGFGDVSQMSGFESQPLLLQHPSGHDTPKNLSVELELQYKISVSAMQDLGKPEIKSEAAIKPEQGFNSSSPCQKTVGLETLHKSDVHEQHYLARRDLKPFRCTICSRSFRLAVNLMRHQDLHKSQKGSQHHAPAEDMRNNLSHSVNTEIHTNSQAITSSPEHNQVDPLDLDIIVKSETWSENCRVDNNSPLKDAELTTSPDQQSVTCQATRRQQRKNILHQCCACCKSFPSLSKLQRHMLTHTGQRPFGCQMCGKRFRQKTHLRVHCRTHLWSKYHKQRSLYISRPLSRTPRFNTWAVADVPTKEMLVHNKNLDEGPSFVFERNDSTREIIMPMSQNNQVMHLSKVPKVTVKKRRTMRKPNNIQHKCLQCFKSFPSASKLQRHEMVHTGLKPFQCLLCGKTFRQAAHLKGHERTHDKLRPLKPVLQQGKISKLKVRSQQQLYPRINIRLPPLKHSTKVHTMHSKFGDAPSNQSGNEQLSSRSEIVLKKVNNIHSPRIKKVACGKKKTHVCRLCLKNFVTPYKLRRHLLTHSGLRPYKCSLCSKAFRQLSHLKAHEHCHRHDNSRSDCIVGEMIRPSRLHNKYLDNCPVPEIFSSAHFIDSNEDVTGEQALSHYTNDGHYLVTDGVFSPYPEAADTEWLTVPQVGLLENTMESKKKQTEPHTHSSFPSELASEIHRLVQNQKAAGLSLSHQENEYSINSSIDRAFQATGVTADSDNHEVPDEGHMSSVKGSQIQTNVPDYYWCKPLDIFECDRCGGSYETEQDLKHHKCTTGGKPKIAQSAPKYHCDICFKSFVSPSKLERHHIIHTGQRPFRCDICGKTFKQSAHLRTHQRIH